MFSQGEGEGESEGDGEPRGARLGATTPPASVHKTALHHSTNIQHITSSLNESLGSKVIG